MSKVQRVTLTAAGLIAFGLGTWFIYIYPDELLQFHFGSAEIEIYKRPAPVWLLVTGLCAAVLLLALWWKYRKPNYTPLVSATH